MTTPSYTLEPIYVTLPIMYLRELKPHMTTVHQYPAGATVRHREIGKIGFVHFIEVTSDEYNASKEVAARIDIVRGMVSGAHSA